MLGLGVSLVILSLVPLAAAARRAGAGRPHRSPGSRWSSGSLLPISRWLLGEPEDQLLDLPPRRADDRRRRDLDDHVQRRRPARRAGAATVGRIRALAPVLQMSIAYPLRSLFRTGVTLAMFTLVVFTLVVGATTTGVVRERLQRPRRLRRRLRRPRDDLAGGADRRTCAAAVARAPGLRPADFRSSSSSRRCRSRRASSATTAKEDSYVVHGVDDALPRATRPTGSPPARAATARPPRSGARSATRPEPRGRRPVRRPAPGELELRAAAGLPADGLLPRGQDVRPGPKVDGSRPQTGKQPTLTVDRRPLRQHARS